MNDLRTRSFTAYDFSYEVMQYVLFIEVNDTNISSKVGESERGRERWKASIMNDLQTMHSQESSVLSTWANKLKLCAAAADVPQTALTNTHTRIQTNTHTCTRV